MKERNLRSAKKVSTLALRKKRAWAARNFPEPEQTLRGSLVERYLTCGKPGCKCARGERHGPVWYVTVTLRAGKTAGMKVPEWKLEQVREWIKNYRKSKESLEAISESNWELLRRER